MGDPETEVVLPRLQTDLVALFAAMDNGTLADVNINFDERSYATIVAVSGGYPGNYEKGKVINLLVDKFTAADSFIFHAGTKQLANEVVTNGGRVLAVTSFGDTLLEAAKKSIAVLDEIGFEGMYFRKDIGYEFENQ